MLQDRTHYQSRNKNLLVCQLHKITTLTNQHQSASSEMKSKSHREEECGACTTQKYFVWNDLAKLSFSCTFQCLYTHDLSPCFTSYRSKRYSVKRKLNTKHYRPLFDRCMTILVNKREIYKRARWTSLASRKLFSHKPFNFGF